MARFLNFIGTAVIIIVIVLCLALVVPRAFGITCYTVLTGSMEPALPVGSVVFAKPTEPAQLKAGDIIVVTGHVGIIGEDGTVIDASSSRQKIMHRPLSSWWSSRFICGWRIF